MHDNRCVECVVFCFDSRFDVDWSTSLPLQGSAWREEKLIEQPDVDDALLRRLVGELTEVVYKAGKNKWKTRDITRYNKISGIRLC